MQRVLVRCNVLKCLAAFCNIAAACCSVMQRVAVCCNVLQCVAVRCSALRYVEMCCRVFQRCCRVLQCVAVCLHVSLFPANRVVIGAIYPQTTLHTATHCNTLVTHLQHTCNMPTHSVYFRHHACGAKVSPLSNPNIYHCNALQHM